MPENNKQLELGVDVEKEHKNLYDLFADFCDKNKLKMPVSEKEFYTIIAKAHLTEFADYYDELDKMENKMKQKLEVSSNCQINTGTSIHFAK